MARNSKLVAFASAQNTSIADELLGSLVAFRKIEVTTIETKVGISDATLCETLLVRNDGSFTHLGERLIFWGVVRRQLEACTEAVPWVAGRLVMSGQAYLLDPLTEADTAAIRKALLSVVG